MTTKVTVKYDSGNFPVRVTVMGSDGTPTSETILLNRLGDEASFWVYPGRTIKAEEDHS